MRDGQIGRFSLAALCAAALSLAGAAQASAAFSDPLFYYVPVPPKVLGKETAAPPPSGYLWGPCGIAVDSAGRFYVSDYYHQVVDVFDPDALSSYTNPSEHANGYEGQLAGIDPLDGPCQPALDAAGNLYVNDYHRGVLGYGAFPSFGAPTVFPLPEEDTERHLPTGIAVDRVTGEAYVDNRTYVSVHEAGGAPLEEAGEEVRIGEGSLQDGYGLARSNYPATLGYLYVADAATNTVEVYDPATDKEDPVQTIAGPPGGFTSLADAALAVDDVSGELYVVDNTQPLYAERPQALVDVFNHTGAYEGHLKYLIVDALPAGLAVDNSAHLNSEGHPTQGRVYVTSGNTAKAGVYGYPPGAATTVSPIPPQGAGSSAASQPFAPALSEAAAGSALAASSPPAGAESAPRSSRPRAHRHRRARRRHCGAGRRRRASRGSVHPRARRAARGAEEPTAPRSGDTC